MKAIPVSELGSPVFSLRRSDPEAYEKSAPERVDTPPVAKTQPTSVMRDSLNIREISCPSRIRNISIGSRAIGLSRIHLRYPVAVARSICGIGAYTSTSYGATVLFP